ncbi:MAG TPA: ABC transporter substrate-binding protein [Acidimicrobiales bacterium]|nr:ABC transporter substrate-binding protein [Acidimicrobiales bacterium]
MRRRVVAVGLAMGLLLAACDSGGNDGNAGTSGKRATGVPIPVGLINMEDAPTGSFPEFRREAETAVDYVNNELDGVAGRPIRLETCTTTGAPETSQACANKLRSKGAVAVIGGVDVGAAASLPVLEESKIPYVGTSPSLGDELTSDDAFMFTGGTGADLLGQAAYAIDTLHVKKVGIVYVDLPGLLATAVEATKEVLEKKGVTDVKLVAAKADSRDLTPALSQVNEGAPDVIVSVFPPQGCARIMQAKESLDIKAKMFYPGVCAEQSVFDSAGSGANGAYFGTGFIPYTDRSNPDVALYLDKREEEPSVLSQAGFSAVMDLRALLADVGPEVTAETLTARLKLTNAQPGFMTHDYTCNGQQVPLLSAICNSNVRILQYQNGRFTDVVGDWVNGASLVTLFTG